MGKYYIKGYLISCAFILTFITALSNADSCQFITATDRYGSSTISAYVFNGQLPRPHPVNQLVTVKNPDLITVSENNKFVIITNSQTGDSSVYSIAPTTCQLADTGNKLIGNGSPNVILQHGKYLYMLLSNKKRIEVFGFNSVTGKVTPSDVATKRFPDTEILTFMAYNSTNNKLYVARNSGITVLSLEPDALSDGYVLKTEREFGLGYTPRQIQTFNNVLFILKPKIAPSQIDDLFVASYTITDTELHFLSKFKIAKSEAPINFLVTHTPFMVDYLPPGFRPEYLLFITSGKRLYTYDLYAWGEIVLGSKVGILDMRYDAPIIASTWNANLNEFQKHMTGSYFRVSLIEPIDPIHDVAANGQTMIMQSSVDTGKGLDSIFSFKTDNVYRQHNMVIAPAPRE